MTFLSHTQRQAIQRDKRLRILYPHRIHWRKHLRFVRPSNKDLANKITQEMLRFCYENFPRGDDHTNVWAYWGGSFGFRHEHHMFAFQIQFRGFDFSKLTDSNTENQSNG